MPQKHVAVTFHRSPVGTNGCVEGLRAAVGLTAGTEENTVACVFFGDAARFALPGTDHAEARKHLDALARMGAPLLVDTVSAGARGVDVQTIGDPFRAAPRAEVAELLRSAGATLSF